MRGSLNRTQTVAPPHSILDVMRNHALTEQCIRMESVSSTIRAGPQLGGAGMVHWLRTGPRCDHSQPLHPGRGSEMAPLFNRRTALLVAIATTLPFISFSARAQMDPAMKPDEARTLAQEAWVFGMPLVYIATQIDTVTHVAKPQGPFAPINQFAHYREFPDASNKTVVGLNVDTLYSLASLDLSQGPIVLSVPEMGNRFWLMQFIDAWNNVPHAPGSRTVGGKGGNFAIVGPAWKGTLPAGLTELRIPTNLVLIGGRTYTRDKDDYPAVHALQDQYKLVPLAEWGKAYTPPADVPLKPGVDSKTPVPDAGAGDVARGFLQPPECPAGHQSAGARRPGNHGTDRAARHRAGRIVQHGRVHP